MDELLNEVRRADASELAYCENGESELADFDFVNTLLLTTSTGLTDDEQVARARHGVKQGWLSGLLTWKEVERWMEQLETIRRERAASWTTEPVTATCRSCCEPLEDELDDWKNRLCLSCQCY